MKKLSFVLLYLLFWSFAYWNLYPEVPCSTYPSSMTNSCDQCFNAWTLYQGVARVGIYDVFNNNTSNPYVYVRSENSTTYSFNIYNWWSMFVSNNLLLYPDELVFYNGSIWQYAMFDPNSQTRFLEARPNWWIRLDGVSSTTDPSIPVFRLVFHANVRQFANWQLWTLEQHRECAFYRPAWCWDWIVSNWEQCDPNDPSQQWWWAWWCSSTCEPITTPSLSCNSLSSILINWREYQFNCNTVQADSAILRIFEWNSIDEWNHIAEIDMNNIWPQLWRANFNFPGEWEFYSAAYAFSNDTMQTITSQWCQLALTITSVQNSCVRWDVSIPLSSTINSSTSWLCPSWQSVVNFNSTVSWRTTSYTWWCNNSWQILEWGNCYASYRSWGWGGWGWGWGWTPRTPPVVPVPDPTVAIPPVCDRIDPPSLQVWEYLPIWWDMENNWNFTDSCSSLADDGKIIRSTLNCWIDITNFNSNILNITRNCFAKDSRFSNTLLSSFRSWDLWELWADGSYVYKLDNINTLWEYKVSLWVDSYRVCRAYEQHVALPNWVVDITLITEEIPMNISNRYCEMNFSITEPYLMQRWATLSTTNSDTLDNFYDISWNNIDTSWVDDIATWFFNPWSISTILNEFVENYDRLAVQNINTWIFAWCRKLVDQEVYYCNNNISLRNIDLPTVPFTLILDWNNTLTLLGSISWNWMYIVPDGNINFQSQSCNIREIVEWIFIWNNFLSETIINNNLSNPWCSDWRLLVRWVMRWNWVQSIADNRRSLIEDWFWWWGISASKIYDWASLLVESNPNIWSNLPPGADGNNWILNILNIERN